MVESIIEVNMSLRSLLADIHALEQELLDFERRYGIRSETMYAAYVAGEEPEDEAWVLDFGEWASIYKLWLQRQAEYRNEVQRRQQAENSLTGLIHVAST
ncbi:hypothetical protein RY27_26995 [Litorilinea aerophila]|nr:hypothetical protein RY27_26995 [Litorilinea aerophila]